MLSLSVDEEFTLTLEVFMSGGEGGGGVGWFWLQSDLRDAKAVIPPLSDAAEIALLSCAVRGT